MAKYGFAKKAMKSWSDDIIKAARKSAKLTDDGIEFASKSKAKKFGRKYNVDFKTGEYKPTMSSPTTNTIFDSGGTRNSTGVFQPENPYGLGAEIKNATQVSDDSIKETIEQVRKSRGTFEPMPKIPSIMEPPTSGNPIFSPVTQGATQMPKISQLEPVAKAPTQVPESKGVSTPKRGPTKENLWEKERAEKKAALKKDERTAKWNKGVQTAVGVGVSGAVVFNMFGSKGQQSNSQLYSNQGY